MNQVIAERLVALNRQFYSDFGDSFSATRGRIQPGVRRILAQLTGTEHILDLGCGNGQLARTLAESGQRGSYLGLDFSLPLLTAAESQPGTFSATFQQVDLTAPDWGSFLPSSLRQAQGKPFDLITSFAFLHHIPGHDLRLNILQKARSLLAPDGKFIHAEWQFMNSEKLKARIQPWELVHLSTADVDVGDALLDWRSDGVGLRYVHHFSAQELDQLATESGFRVVESFLSDGEGGKLSLYQIWALA
jgi:tRNA (uracil-5-)-methyltransferase TRM9